MITYKNRGITFTVTLAIAPQKTRSQDILAPSRMSSDLERRSEAGRIVCHQMARYDLSNSVLELNEAAYMLGFEDPNSFGRVFRSWRILDKHYTKIAVRSGSNSGTVFRLFVQVEAMAIENHLR